MGQGSSSSNSASQIVDEEALALAGKSKGKAKKKKDGKKNIDMSKVKCTINDRAVRVVAQMLAVKMVRKNQSNQCTKYCCLWCLSCKLSNTNPRRSFC